MKKSLLSLWMTILILPFLTSCQHQSNENSIRANISITDLSTKVKASSNYLNYLEVQNEIDIQLANSVQNAGIEIRKKYQSVRSKYESQLSLIKTTNEQDKKVLMSVIENISLPVKNLQLTRDKIVNQIYLEMASKYQVSKTDIAKALGIRISNKSARLPTDCWETAKDAKWNAVGWCIELGFGTDAAYYIGDYVYNSTLDKCLADNDMALC